MLCAVSAHQHALLPVASSIFTPAAFPAADASFCVCPSMCVCLLAPCLHLQYVYFSLALWALPGPLSSVVTALLPKITLSLARTADLAQIGQGNGHRAHQCPQQRHEYVVLGCCLLSLPRSVSGSGLGVRWESRAPGVCHLLTVRLGSPQFPLAQEVQRELQPLKPLTGLLGAGFWVRAQGALLHRGALPSLCSTSKWYPWHSHWGTKSHG